MIVKARDKSWLFPVAATIREACEDSTADSGDPASESRED